MYVLARLSARSHTPPPVRALALPLPRSDPRPQDATFDMPQDNLEVSPNNLRIETYADRKAATVSVLRQARKRISSKDASPRSSRATSRDTSQEDVAARTQARQSLIDQIKEMDQEANGGGRGGGGGGGHAGAAGGGSGGVPGPGGAEGGQPSRAQAASGGREDRRASFNSKLWDLSQMSEANATK